MSLVWQQAPYSGNTLLVFLALADWCNDDGFCWPSMLQLANKARIEKRSAQRIIRHLAEDGMITIDEGGGRRQPHRYHIQVSRVTKCHPLQNGDTDRSETVTPATETVTLASVNSDTPVTRSTIEPPITTKLDPPYRGIDFLAALKGFEQSRTEMKKPLTTEARRLLYRKLASWGERDATQALEDSTINRWQGVFEPRNNGHAKSSGQNNGSSSFEFTPKSKIC